MPFKQRLILTTAKLARGLSVKKKTKKNKNTFIHVLYACRPLLYTSANGCIVMKIH